MEESKEQHRGQKEMVKFVWKTGSEEHKREPRLIYLDETLQAVRVTLSLLDEHMFLMNDR